MTRPAKTANCSVQHVRQLHLKCEIALHAVQCTRLHVRNPQVSVLDIYSNSRYSGDARQGRWPARTLVSPSLLTFMVESEHRLGSPPLPPPVSDYSPKLTAQYNRNIIPVCSYLADDLPELPDGHRRGKKLVPALPFLMLSHQLVSQAHSGPAPALCTGFLSSRPQNRQALPVLSSSCSKE